MDRGERYPELVCELTDDSHGFPREFRQIRLAREVVVIEARKLVETYPPTTKFIDASNRLREALDDLGELEAAIAKEAGS